MQIESIMQLIIQLAQKHGLISIFSICSEKSTKLFYKLHDKLSVIS